MKRTCLQKNNYDDEQNSCELHRVIKLINERNYNLQLISNI